MSSKQPTYPPTTIAKLLMISERRLQQLAKEGVIPKTERGRYELAPTVQAYIKFIRDRKSANPESTIDFNFEKARKTKAEADLAEMEVEKARGSLVTADDVARAIENDYLYIKDRFRTIPTRVAPLLVGEQNITKVKEILIHEIDDILVDLSSEYVLPDEQPEQNNENNSESEEDAEAAA